MAKNETTSKGERAISFFGLWVARLALAVLAVAGAKYFLGGVDPVIAWTFAVVGVSFLLKETL